MPMSEVTSRSTTFHRDSPQREDPWEATISFAGHLALPPKAIQRSRRVEWMELRMRSQRVPFLVVILWLILSLEALFTSNQIKNQHMGGTCWVLTMSLFLVPSRALWNEHKGLRHWHNTMP